MGFAVTDILVEGREYTDPHVLLAIVNIRKGDPLFAFNPRQAQELISQISWVNKAQVERRWPGTIYIGLEERQPLALWQSDKHLKLLDSKGKIIATSDLQRFADLVLVMGRGAPAAAPELIGNLKAEEKIYPRVETAKWIGERRWDLKLKNGMEIKLPERDASLALRRLAEAQGYDGLLDKDLLSIDMREPDRITIRTKPGAVQEYKTDLKIEAATRSKAGNNI
ncbi:MAG: FtsQ-type POTRA domain-containing protein [Rhodospirillales bacterium]|nr:FtsQ-type POTRA domain-containing protein [Rhodospirillales bacterium]